MSKPEKKDLKFSSEVFILKEKKTVNNTLKGIKNEIISNEGSNNSLSSPEKYKRKYSIINNNSDKFVIKDDKLSINIKKFTCDTLDISNDLISQERNINKTLVKVMNKAIIEKKSLQNDIEDYKYNTKKTSYENNSNNNILNSKVMSKKDLKIFNNNFISDFSKMITPKKNRSKSVFNVTNILKNEITKKKSKSIKDIINIADENKKNNINYNIIVDNNNNNIQTDKSLINNNKKILENSLNSKVLLNKNCSHPKQILKLKESNRSKSKKKNKRDSYNNKKTTLNKYKIIENRKLMIFNNIQDSMSELEDFSYYDFKPKWYSINPKSSLYTTNQFFFESILFLILIYLPLELVYFDINKTGPYTFHTLLESLLIISYSINFVTGVYEPKTRQINYNLYYIFNRFYNKSSILWMIYEQIIIFFNIFFIELTAVVFQLNKEQKINFYTIAISLKFMLFLKLNHWIHINSILKNINELMMAASSKINRKKNTNNSDLKKLNLIVNLYKVSSVVKVLVYYLIFIHIASCMWISIYLTEEFYNNHDHWVTNMGLFESDFQTIYIASFYFSVTTLLSVGYGDIRPFNFNERIFNIIFMAVGILFYSFLVTLISYVIVKNNIKRAIFIEKVKVLTDINDEYKIENKLYKNIYKSISHSTLAFNKDKLSLVEDLPNNLKDVILLKMYSTIISTLNILNSNNKDFILNTCRYLKTHAFDKYYKIIHVNQKITEVFCILKGEIVLQLDEEHECYNISKLTNRQHFMDYFIDNNITVSPYTIETTRNLNEILTLSVDKYKLLDEKFPATMEEIRNKNLFFNLLIEEIRKEALNYFKQKGTMNNFRFYAISCINNEIKKDLNLYDMDNNNNINSSFVDRKSSMRMSSFSGKKSVLGTLSISKNKDYKFNIQSIFKNTNIASKSSYYINKKDLDFKNNALRASNSIKQNKSLKEILKYAKFKKLTKKSFFKCANKKFKKYDENSYLEIGNTQDKIYNKSLSFVENYNEIANNNNNNNINLKKDLKRKKTVVDYIEPKVVKEFKNKIAKNYSEDLVPVMFCNNRSNLPVINSYNINLIKHKSAAIEAKKSNLNINKKIDYKTIGICNGYISDFDEVINSFNEIVYSSDDNNIDNRSYNKTLDEDKTKKNVTYKINTIMVENKTNHKEYNNQKTNMFNNDNNTNNLTIHSKNNYSRNETINSKIKEIVKLYSNQTEEEKIKLRNEKEKEYNQTHLIECINTIKNLNSYMKDLLKSSSLTSSILNNKKTNKNKNIKNLKLKTKEILNRNLEYNEETIVNNKKKNFYDILTNKNNISSNIENRNNKKDEIKNKNNYNKNEELNYNKIIYNNENNNDYNINFNQIKDNNSNNVEYNNVYSDIKDYTNNDIQDLESSQRGLKNNSNE